MKKFKIIYADCPWEYKDKRDKGKRKFGGAEVHYKSLSLDALKELRVNEIADENCFLFLWATFPNLNIAFDVIKSWGFTYKTIAFNWIKLNKKNKEPFFGIGAYTRSNSEICLLATKGKPKVINKSISSIHMSPREEHSKKPNEIRDKIVSLCGDISRLEMFAREKYEGWTCLGNEIDGKDIRDALKELTLRRSKFKIK